FDDKRIAVVAIDPTRRRSGGALLGDRLRMNALASPRIFMRSLATGQHHASVSASLRDVIALYTAAQFDLIIVETAGTGQGDSEIVDHVDIPVYVMTCEFGAPSQLEKIDMLDYAHFIALNKADKPGSEDALRDVRKHGAEAEMTEKDVDALFELFVKPANDGSLVTADQRLNHGLLFDQYQDLFPSKSNPINVKQTLLSGDMVELLARVEGHDSRRAALEIVKELRPDDWPEVFAESFISLDPRTATWVEKELKSSNNEHFRQVALESVLAKPDANPDLFVWASRNILEGTWDHLGDTIRPIMVCEELLSLLSELEDLAASEHEAVAAIARAAGTKIRSLLNEGNSKYFKQAVQKSTVEEARKILRTIRLHNSLSHQLKSALEMILINEHQDLRKASRLEEEEERRRPSYHYTTRQSLDEKRTQLSRLVSEEIPAMAKVIETARELGDLRENAEYHAAKDRQKLLMQQAAELEDL
ncbi:MAG TPA: hypothetical protein PKD58_09160, partial [Candidatus Sumerlaeota bacterium]|nr:hypothetical protein [Candidatus Sumerlaeota bacterium]